jgi:hypothetical protein
MSRARRTKKLLRSLEAPADHPIFTRGFMVGGTVLGPKPSTSPPPEDSHPSMDSPEFAEMVDRWMEELLSRKAKPKA